MTPIGAVTGLATGAAMPRLLEAIPPGQLAGLARDLNRVHVPAGRLLATAHDAPRRVFFPDTAVVAESLAMGDGRTAGVGIVGTEGMVGVATVAGPSAAAGTEATVQVAGSAWTMTSERFRAALAASDGLRATIERYLVAVAAQRAQTVACNRLHGLDERAARWLLLIHDRIEGDTFALTQESFADLLGVSRPAVSTVGAQLARAGAAEFRRGVVHVHDPRGLEAASCECVVADREAFRPTRRHVAAVEHNHERSRGLLRPEIRRAR